jgi:prepilin-type N-terminal cleavage/methylation domain-containing protein
VDVRRIGVHREDGFSLIELLITIVIVGIAFAALLGGLMTSIVVSSVQREQATADAVLRSAAEWVKDPIQNPFHPCASPGNYSLSGLAVPSGYSVSIPPGGIENWNAPAAPMPASYAIDPDLATSACSDHGLQRITIAVTSPDGQANESVQVIKRAVS